MNQTIPPPPKGYRVITEEERRALHTAYLSDIGGIHALWFSETDQKWSRSEICCAFNAVSQPYAIRYDEWIPWAGNDFCPLPVGTKVDVRLKNGAEATTVVSGGIPRTTFGHWKPQYSPESGVTAYRVHEPEQVNEIPSGYVYLNPEYEPVKEPGSDVLYQMSPPPETKTYREILNEMYKDLAATLPTPQPQQQTNENTMATTTSLESTLGYSLPSTRYAIPEVGSTWAFEWINRTRIAKIVSASHDAICFKDKGGDIQIVTASAWHSLAKTPIKTRKELKQMAKQNRPGNIIVKTGGSRKRWFLIGAAAMYVGKPYLPAAAYHVMQFINSL